MVRIAEEFSPRYECVGEDGVVIDLEGLRRLFGDPRAIGDALHQTAMAHGVSARIAIAGTQTGAHVLAHAREGVTVMDTAQESRALAPLPIDVLASVMTSVKDAQDVLHTFKTWGLRTLGDVAALPRADLRARLGPAGLLWQTIARGEDVRPLRPERPDERFEGVLDLEWPIEGLDPLSFVLTRLLDPLSIQLERRDRGVATIHVALRLVTRETHARQLDLPAPMRDVRTLRTLLLLDLESHPPAAAIDRVIVVIEPTPAWVVQHTLFTRSQPAPEQVATLVARLEALMGSDRVGTPVAMDTDRPGAFAMRPFRTLWDESRVVSSPAAIVSAFRRYRQPVPVRVALDEAHEPVRVDADRAGFEGGRVLACAGPWKTSGAWWQGDRWNREEWDIRLASGVTYRLAHHNDTGRWFIHAVAD